MRINTDQKKTLTSQYTREESSSPFSDQAKQGWIGTNTNQPLLSYIQISLYSIKMNNTFQNSLLKMKFKASVLSFKQVREYSSKTLSYQMIASVSDRKQHCFIQALEDKGSQ